MAGEHNPFLVDDDDSEDDNNDDDDHQMLLRTAARANVAADVAYAHPDDDFVNDQKPMMTMMQHNKSSVFSKEPRAAVPPVGGSSGANDATMRRGNTTARTPTRTSTSSSGGGFWIFSFAFYQKYFDVDTADVVRRIKKGTYGALGGALFLDDVKEKPDLYGAFWGCATLVFVVAMGGNFADYLESMSGSGSSSKKRMMMRRLLEEEGNVPPPPSPVSAPPARVDAIEPWQFDVTKVSQCAAMTYAYVFLFPLSLYLVKRCYAGVRSASYTALVCLYGYSIMSYIPASILCIFPVETLRWVAVMTACAVSSASLFRNVDALLKGESGNAKAMAIAKGMGVAIVGANVIFAIALKELFFRF